MGGRYKLVHKLDGSGECDIRDARENKLVATFRDSTFAGEYVRWENKQGANK